MSNKSAPPLRILADPRSIAILIAIVLALTTATMLLCEVPNSSGEILWPSTLVKLVTAPLRSTGMSDLRNYSLATALALAFIAMAVFPRRLAVAVKRTPDQLSPASRHLNVQPTFEYLAIATVAVSIASACINHTWDISRGWILQFAVACTWAILLGRVCNRQLVTRAFLAISVVAVVAFTLSLGHAAIMGQRYFELPIGPVTLTAPLGALCCVSVAAWGLGALTVSRTQRLQPMTYSWLAIAFAISLTLTYVAGRRGAWLALCAALAFAIAVALWPRVQKSLHRFALLVLLVAFLVSAGLYSLQHMRKSTLSQQNSSLFFRTRYWNRIVHELPHNGLAGIGPDMFVFKMTQIMARDRAEMPRVLQGNVDFDAHNEWLQAAYELGIPGGVLYLAMPLLVLAGTVRILIRNPEHPNRAALLAGAAAIVTILVGESASVNLRQPVLNAWYWTVMGLTLAAMKPTRDENSGARSETTAATARVNPRRSPLLRFACVALAAALLYLVVTDIRRANRQIAGRLLTDKNDLAAIDLLQQAQGRLRAAHWLGTHFELALAKLNYLRTLRSAAGDKAPLNNPDGSLTELGRASSGAIAAWRTVTDRCPAYAGAAYGLTETLTLSNRIEESCIELQKQIEQINPYDKRVNAMIAAICVTDPLQKLLCVRRALRSAELDALLERRLSATFKLPGVSEAWQPLVQQALADVAKPRTDQWTDPLTPETLRIEAYRLIIQKDAQNGARLQQLAAEAYRNLERQLSSLRRPANVEADTWYRAAICLLYLDPSQYAVCEQMIEQAELYASLGILTEPVRGAPPHAEYVGGVVMPVEDPDWLRPLWKFSAMVHLANERSPQSVRQRIEWSLSDHERTIENVNHVLAALSYDLVQIYNAQPPERRPHSFARLQQLAAKFKS